MAKLFFQNFVTIRKNVMSETSSIMRRHKHDHFTTYLHVTKRKHFVTKLTLDLDLTYTCTNQSRINGPINAHFTIAQI